MKTKFILHGGYAGRPNKNNDKFFKEILRGRQKNLKILLVYFAKRKLDYKRVKKEDVSQFEKSKGDKTLSFEIASKDLFVRQLKQSDIIYLHGGKTLKLLIELKKVSDLRRLLDGKVVAGESAGAYVLSSCFYSKSEKGILNGLGFVPVKTICHYVGEDKDKLKQCRSDLKELLLKDYQYRVFEI